MIWIILFGYVVPFVINYIIIREEVRRNEIRAGLLEFFGVVLPVFNLTFMMFDTLYSDVVDDFAKKFFMLNKKGD